MNPDTEVASHPSSGEILAGLKRVRQKDGLSVDAVEAAPQLMRMKAVYGELLAQGRSKDDAATVAKDLIRCVSSSPALINEEFSRILVMTMYIVHEDSRGRPLDPHNYTERCRSAAADIGRPWDTFTKRLPRAYKELAGELSSLGRSPCEVEDLDDMAQAKVAGWRKVSKRVDRDPVLEEFVRWLRSPELADAIQLTHAQRRSSSAREQSEIDTTHLRNLVLSGWMLQLIDAFYAQWIRAASMKSPRLFFLRKAPMAKLCECLLSDTAFDLGALKKTDFVGEGPYMLSTVAWEHEEFVAETILRGVIYSLDALARLVISVDMTNDYSTISGVLAGRMATLGEKWR